MSPRTPPQHRIDAVRRMHANGDSRATIAKALGITRNAATGLVARYVHNRHWTGGGRKAHHTPRLDAPSRTWSERYLTEPYAQRKARKQAEKSTIR